ncbi:hypothetical protein N431DRAFT_457903 [Stipitochalara longipes BDJ]|nr:hypothetical protein N431DRAFT_457903 [Stipitochalara longipes BDJ]
MAAQRPSRTSGWAHPEDMQLTVQHFSSLAIKKGDKNVKEPSFFSPSQMVTFVIGIGEGKETFVVHKEHACKYSPVLEKAFNSRFKEGQTKSQYHNGMTTEEKQEHYEICGPQTDIQIQLWVLAEKLLVPRLQNELMDVFGLVSTTCLAPFEYRVEYIYQTPPRTAPSAVSLSI